MYLNIAFTCIYNKPVDGIAEQCLVLVNGVPEPIEAWQTDEYDDFITADYSVEIVGDMDIQIIHQNNGRKLSVVNGDGGTIALYGEGETEPIGTINNGTSYEKVLPQDIAHYAVITPQAGKEVFALFVNKPLSETARLQLDASQYLQEDGTYRVPLSGFADSKDTYRLTVLYVDRPSYSFNLAVVGDGSLKCIPFRVEDGVIQAIREVTVSEANGRNQTAKAFYDEIGETGYVEFWLTAPKEGEIVKVYMDGLDVSSKFKPLENMNNEYLRGVFSSSPDEDDLGVLTSASLLAVYEENANMVDWKATMVGDTGSKARVVIMVDGGSAEIDLYPTTPNKTETFDVSVFGTQLQLYVFAEPVKSVQLLFNGEDYTELLQEAGTENGLKLYKIEGDTFTQFFTSGNWVFSYKKMPDLIEFADDNVKAICVENWDTDGDHELSKTEAAAVTTLKKDNGDGTFGDPVFKENSVITSFDELQYFTGLTTIDEYAFHTCTALASVKLPDGVKTLHNYSFKNCSSLQHIQLPEGLDKLNTEVFANTGLTSIFIPKSVTSVSEDAFVGCAQLQSIVIEDGPSKYSSPNGCNAVIYNRAIIMLQSGCRNTVIPDNVVMISQKAFKGQTELTKIVIPSSVSIINQEAFYGCSNLTSVVVERETPATLGTSAFGGISADCILTVPAGCAEAYADWAQYFKEIVEEPAREDLNNDGQVNIADVTKLVNKVVGKE